MLLTLKVKGLSTDKPFIIIFQNLQLLLHSSRSLHAFTLHLQILSFEDRSIDLAKTIGEVYLDHLRIVQAGVVLDEESAFGKLAGQTGAENVAHTQRDRSRIVLQETFLYRCIPQKDT